MQKKNSMKKMMNDVKKCADKLEKEIYLLKIEEENKKTRIIKNKNGRIRKNSFTK